MTLFIFLGDMLVMAFMIGVAIWFGTRGKAEASVAAARIPLEDEIFVGHSALGKTDPLHSGGAAGPSAGGRA